MRTLPPAAELCGALALSSLVNVATLSAQALPELEASAQALAGACDGESEIDLDYQTRLAHHFAPIYWFAPDERYYPTLPYFAAFDGVDNDDSGSRDFEDPQEILPLDADGRPDWARLNEWYREARAKDGDRLAVFYRVRDLESGDIDEIFRYLRSDEQAWKRLGEREDQADILDRVRSDSTRWMSVEYYVYYVNDWGLVGHPYDVEFVMVFLPCRISDNTFELAGRFRLFVGPGHTDRVPSNVLLVNGDLADREVTIWPDSSFCRRAMGAFLGRACAVPTRRGVGIGEAASSGRGRRRPPSVLVELGDHSSSPDVDPFGLFDAGHDANWHINDLWGTRDVQATSALGFLGRYESWMTLPRTENNSIVMYPYFISRQEALERQTSEMAPDGSDGGGNRSREETTVDSVETREYALLPATSFDSLFRSATEGEPGVGARLRELAREIELQQVDDWKGFAVPSVLPTDSTARFRRWNEEMRTDRGTVGPSNSFPWASPHYRGTPTRAFKTELFRPVWDGPGTIPALINFWYTLHGDRAALLQTGLVFPALEILPVRFSGFAEVRLGLYCSERFLPCAGHDRQSFAASFVHTNHYNAGVTWYGKLTWVEGKRRVDQDPEISRWTLGAGVSLAPASLIASRHGIMGLLRSLAGWSRVQLGVATDFSIAEFEISISPLDPVLRRALRR